MINLKVITCIAILICLANAMVFEEMIGIPPADPPNARAKAPVWGTITQKLDHFNSTDTRTWSMRFLSSDQFYRPGGPLFIYLGGEWEIKTDWLMNGQMFDMAMKHNGYMLYTEHRFYGRSWPLGDFSTKSLKYIRSQQALADLAKFISSIKKSIDGAQNSKVIVVGCSYAASLATWSRLFYPQIIDVAYASSGPLVAIDDFYRFNEVVGKNIALNSPECYKVLNEGIAVVEDHFSTNERIEILGKLLNTCRPIQNVEPYKAYFYTSITATWRRLVQNARPGVIANECNKLTSKPGTSFEKLVAYIREKNGQQCISDYSDLIRAYTNTNLTTGTSRQWLFQTCEEFGFYQTTSSPYQPFGNHVFVDYFHSICRDLFGQEYTSNRIKQNINYSNKVYGGINRNMSYVISVHGNVDPWHPLGVTSGLHQLAPAYLVPGTSHCQDQYSISPSDSEEMRRVKQGVQDQIAAWIG